VSTTSYITGEVTGVDYQSGETMLLIGDQEVPIASLIRVENVNTDNTDNND
jgi:flagellar basal-body rod modification protein FlgD